MEHYSVYWIHLNNHDDPYNQGYVGITGRCPHQRLAEHKKGRTRVSSAIRSHSDIILTVLYDKISKEEAVSIERLYRPDDNIGWNLTCGGNVPPSNKGKFRPEQSVFMKNNNPSARADVRAKISSALKGRVGPLTGKKRPTHSLKMKQKSGELYPKFRGYFITPWGTFSSYNDAVSASPQPISAASLYNYCIKNNKKKITTQAICKSPLLRALVEGVSTTYADLGFGFKKHDRVL